MPFVDIHVDLVKDCQTGNPAAQKKLFFLYKDAMFNICLRMLQNRHEAEDILQDSFIDVFKNLDKFKAESTIGAWIKRIVVNKCINRLKRKRIEFTEMDQYEESSHQIESSLEHKLLSIDRITKAVERLPAGYRVILSLYLFEGYDHQEIATILSISESTSKSQYSRAKKKLRVILQEQSSHPGGLLIAL